jgi:cystathionine beta-lyase/cystathionine gamma-synthase
MAKGEWLMNRKETEGKGVATRCIHTGVPSGGLWAPVKTPLIMSNSYNLGGQPVDDLPDEAFVYTRNGTPNARYLEEKLADLEGAEDCVLTASGVAAISGSFLTLLNTGDHIISSDVVYIAIHDLLVEDLPKRLGINTSLVDTSDPAAVRAALTPKTKIIHVETPGNPTTRISDIAAIAEIAREAGVLLTVDSTWSGLLSQQPLALGADLVLHSLSKYINGQGDAVAGAVLGSQALIERVREFAVTRLGGCISPFNAWQIMRGSETLPLRLERHSDNALAVAEFLESHPKVAWVRYPGLPSHPQHEVARGQMKYYSGMLNFETRGNPGQRIEVIRRLKFFSHATCLGHDESLIALYPWEDPQFFRVSVGLEDAEDLIDDLDQALAVVEA